MDYIKNTWQALSTSSLTLKGPPITQPSQRLHDHHLMDVFLSMDPDTSDLQALQDCRLFLEVTTLSDTCTARGSRIEKRAWEGKTLLHHRTSPQWVGACRPHKSKWEIWQHYLSEAFLHPTHPTELLLLAVPLGTWHSSDR